ncbi:MAG: MJ0042-type zinc finger domain-containing protein, partial [Steroidobacteraceae bacterium]
MTLVVTAADLRVAQGYVRCGRCSSVFNALAQLTEDGQGAAGVAPESPPAPAAPPADPDERPPAPAAPDDESIPEAALEFDPETTDAASVFVQPPPDPQWTAATGSFRAMVAADQEPQPEAADQQVDVEIDAALLSDIVRGDP